MVDVGSSCGGTDCAESVAHNETRGTIILKSIIVVVHCYVGICCVNIRFQVTLNSYTFENVAFSVLHERTPKFTYSDLTRMCLLRHDTVRLTRITQNRYEWCARALNERMAPSSWKFRTNFRRLFRRRRVVKSSCPLTSKSSSNFFWNFRDDGDEGVHTFDEASIMYGMQARAMIGCVWKPMSGNPFD